MALRRSRKNSDLPKPEELLHDYARRLDRHRKGRRAVCVRLSTLSKYYRQSHYQRAAAEAFQPLLKRYDGQIFQLSNSDIVFSCKGASVAEIDKAVFKVRYMFRDDERLRAAEENAATDNFCAWYDIEADYHAFASFATNLVQGHGPAPDAAPDGTAPVKPTDKTADKTTGQTTGKPATKPTIKPVARLVSVDQPKPPAKTDTRRPLDAAHMAKLETVLSSMDVTSLIRKQQVLLLADDVPQPVIERRHVPIGAIETAVLPTYDLSADPWFAGRIRELVARRLLIALIDTGFSPLACAVELTVDTVLSPAFDDFERSLGGQPRNHIIVGLALADALVDSLRFRRARAKLDELGYRMSLGAIDPVVFPTVDRTPFAADFEIVHWHPDGATGLYPEDTARFQAALKTSGAARVILADCDDPAAMAFGREAGVRLYCGTEADRLHK